MKAKAVIDTACTKTIAGKIWLDNCIIESHLIFKFGDGSRVITTSTAKLLAQILVKPNAL